MKAPSTHGSSKCKGWAMKLLESCLSHWHLDVMENEQGFLYYLGPIIVKKLDQNNIEILLLLYIRILRTMLLK